MKNLLLLSALSFSLNVTAQQTAEVTSSKGAGETFTYVEKMPTFKDDMSEFLAKNIRYPSEALENDIQGRVLVRFIINTKGDVDSPTVVKGIGGGCDEEAVRVIKMMKFQPGTQNGEAVNVYYTIPIQFTLEGGRRKRKHKD
jgi:protein TonB